MLRTSPLANVYRDLVFGRFLFQDPGAPLPSFVTFKRAGTTDPNDGRLDEVLAACPRLLAEFPDVVDGLERSAMVHAKMGPHALAAHFYRQAFHFVNHPSRSDDYEEHDYYRERADRQPRLADLA